MRDLLVVSQGLDLVASQELSRPVLEVSVTRINYLVNGRGKSQRLLTGWSLTF